MANMHYSRIYAGPDGASHIENVDVELTPTGFVPGRPPVDLAEAIPAQSMVFARLAPGWYGSAHPSPRRQFCVGVSGKCRITVSDGEAHEFGPGAVFLLDDTTGDGHDTLVTGTTEWTGVLVPLPG